MQSFLSSIINPPVFPDDENKTRSARYGHWIALVFMVIIFFYETVGKLASGLLLLNVLDFILIALFIVLFACWRLIGNGHVRPANTVLVLLLWVGVNGIAFLGFGVRDSAYIANFIVILAAGLLRGWRTAVFLTFLTILSGFSLAYAETNNLSPTAYYVVTPYTVMQDVTAVYIIYAVFIFLLISGLDSALKNAQAGKNELEIANRDLHESQTRLEESRNELLVSNEQLTRRTERINTISEISRAVTSVQDVRKLLSAVVNTISQRLGYYHVGIYFVDAQKQFASLRASNSEAGMNMIKQNYRLRVGEQSIVGFVAHSEQPFLVAEAVPDRTVFSDPKLPETISEIALPLKSGDELIGVLHIQSPEANAFSDDDASTLSILADQVAIAIQNAFLFERSEKALREAEIASRQSSGQLWGEYEKTLPARGYRYDGIKSEALNEADSTSASPNLLNVPVRLRGQTIGNLKLKPVDSSRNWNEDELAIIAATSERVALALEGSRLLNDAQKRATRETFLAEVSAKLGASFQLDSILRDTVEELGKNLKGSTVSFQLVNPSVTSSTAPQKSNGASASGEKAE
jgi:GAF domain-containing protein